MIRRWIFPCIWLLFFLVACREEAVPATPTPFGYNQTAVPVVAMGQPTAVAIPDLLAAPDTFAGQYMQLTGNYKPLPLLVCSTDPHPGPASWSLVAAVELELEEGDDLVTPTAVAPLIVAVGGFDAQLRQLVSQGTPVTVNGYWLEWSGVVGCGKQAVPRQIWYLRATELVSPNQLARLTAVPDPNDPNQPAPTDEATLQPTDPITGTPPIDDTTPIAVTATREEGTAVATSIVLPTLEPTGLSAYPGQTVTAVSPTVTAVTETPSPNEGSTPDATPPIAGTATPPDGTGTSTAVATTPISATPGPSATPGTYTVVDVDPINPDASMYGIETLEPWQKQNWQMTLTSSQLITISVAAEPTMDLVIAVFDNQQNLLVEQNSSPAGHLESIINLIVDPSQRYVVQVYERQGLPGDYFITLVGDDPDIVLSSRGVLTYGQTGQDHMHEGHYHFWYFYGQQGDVVNITTVAADSRLLLLTLYNHEGDVMQDSSGRNLEYVEETISNFTVPETGLYLIWLEEAIFDPATYSITISRP